MNLISDPALRSLVEYTLFNCWKKYQTPICLQKHELAVGLSLFTDMILEKVSEIYFNYELNATNRELRICAEPVPESNSEVVKRIQELVQRLENPFRTLFRVNFCFSVLNSATAQQALKRTLLANDFMLYASLASEKNLLNEEDLEIRFGSIVEQLHIKEICQTCFKLQNMYHTYSDKKAGYYLLWIIKKRAGLSLEIPKITDFTPNTVGEQICKGELDSMTNVIDFIQILFYRMSRNQQLVYQSLFRQTKWKSFLTFVLNHLQTIPFNQWPYKGFIITEILESLASTTDKLHITKKLVGSRDIKTFLIGKCVLRGFQAETLPEACSHFSDLKILLPHLNNSQSETIFNIPFFELFRSKEIDQCYPSFAIKTIFNHLRSVIVYNNLIIGTYDPHREESNRLILPPYLLAFDQDTGKLIWAIPAVPNSLMPKCDPLDRQREFNYQKQLGFPKRLPKDFILERVGSYILFYVSGDANLYFIQPETGEIKLTLEIPENYYPALNRYHIFSDKLMYRIISKGFKASLLIGEIENGEWKQTAETIVPQGYFFRLSTHVAVEENRSKIVLIGPAGHQKTFEGCLSIAAYNDQLYTIEIDPENTDKRLLKIRTLTMDETVCSEPSMSISTAGKIYDLQNCYENGQLIAFSEKENCIVPVFINLKSLKFVYMDDPSVLVHESDLDSHHIINPEKPEMWLWKYESKVVWKITPEKITCMGELNHEDNLVLINCKNDHLYFASIP